MLTPFDTTTPFKIIYHSNGFAVLCNNVLALDGTFFETQEDAHEALSALGVPACRVIFNPSLRCLDLTIDAARVPYVQAILDHVRAKANKLKTTCTTIATFGESLTRSFTVDGPQQSRLTQTRTVCKATIVYTIPALAGWRVTAIIDHTLQAPGSDGTLVHMVDRETQSEPWMRSAKPFCGHCKTMRKRNKTVVLVHTDGKQIQVGTDCLKDFTGQDATNLLASLGIYSELCRLLDAAMACDDGFDCGGTIIPKAFDIQAYVTMCAMLVRTEGWQSRKQAAESNKSATADDAWTFVRVCAGGAIPGTRNPVEYVPVPTQADIDTAAAAIEWARTMDASSDYLHNLQTVCRAGFVTRRGMGFAASVVAAHARVLDAAKKAAEPKDGPVSQALGTVGERIRGLHVTFLETRVVGDGWHLAKLVDDAGNKIAVFGALEAKPGESFWIDGTPKAHREFRGQMETTLNRVTVSHEAPVVKVKKVRAKKAAA